MQVPLLLKGFTLFSLFSPFSLYPFLNFLYWHTHHHTWPSLHIHCNLSFSLFLDGVVDDLQTGGFFNDKVTKSCLFSSVHDAVLYCQASGEPSRDEVTYCMRPHKCTHIKTCHASKNTKVSKDQVRCHF